MKLNISYDGQTISVADGESITLKCKDLKARGNIAVSAVADVVEPEMQTLTVINSNNESETATFTMPNGYTFSQFIGSEYDTSGGAFEIAVHDETEYVFYNGHEISTDGSHLNTIAGDTICSGTFYYAGESAPERTYELSGTWVFNENVDTVDITGNVSFINNNILFKSMFVDTRRIYYRPTYDSSSGEIYVYGGDTWLDDSYRTITFDGVQTVSEKFYEWFIANALEGSN